MKHLLVLSCAAVTALRGQQPVPANPQRVSVLATSLTTKLTIGEAMDLAVATFPSIAAAEQQLAAANASVKAGQLTSLHRAEAIAGINQATRNNVYGLVLPDSMVASSITGTTPANVANAWGSMAGVLVRWEPLDLGHRRRNLQNQTTAAQQRAGRQVELARFEMAHATADAFLTVLAAEQTAKAVSTGVLRSMALRALAESEEKAGRRPASDATRQQVESTLLLNQVIQAEQARDLAKSTLNQLTGKLVNPDGSRIVEHAPKTVWEKVPLANHPQAREQEAAAGEAHARFKATGQSALPTFTVDGAAFSRSIAWNNATGNWALGATLHVPLTDFRQAAAQREVEADRERAEQSRYQRVLRDLDGQLERARALLMGSQRMATSIGDNLAAARAHRDALFEGYRTGKASVIEVADADRLLTQAEIDAALVNLSIWRAVLSVAAASGDLAPFRKQTE